MMHAADPHTSPRLQRVLSLLADQAEHSTMDICRGAEVCAVNSCVAELRHAGAEIVCTIKTLRAHDGARRRIWFYRMTRPPKAPRAAARRGPGVRAKHQRSGS